MLPNLIWPKATATSTATATATATAALLLLLALNAAVLIGADINGCSYEQTVELTAQNSKLLANGSYNYEGLIIPPALIGDYDYELLYDGERNKVAPYKRACACKLKPCIRFCCHPRSSIVNFTRECDKNLQTELNYDPYVNITFDNGTTLAMHALKEYVLQTGVPCEYAYPLQEPDDTWKIFENGTLLREYDNRYLSSRDYCLHPFNKDDGSYGLAPHNCPLPAEPTQTQHINIIATIISVPFMCFTIFVYLFVPRLRNFHGKCLVSYLTSLAIGYVLLIVIFYNNGIAPLPCRLIGFTGYFAFMSAFFWLTVISLDLWNTFRGTNYNVHRLASRYRYRIVSLYAFGSAGILTLILYFANSSKLAHPYHPSLGDPSCWIKIEDWSAMIYFFGPMLALIIFNFMLFISTANQIYQLRKELQRMIERVDDTKRLGTEQQNFGLFLRLFIIMGVTWLLEIASYVVGNDTKWSQLFFISDLCNAAQGFIIFAVFVLKRRVLRLFAERYSELRYGKSNTTTNSTSLRSSQHLLRKQAAVAPS